MESNYDKLLMKAEHECVLRYQIAGCLFKWEQTLRHNTWRDVSTQATLTE